MRAQCKDISEQLVTTSPGTEFNVNSAASYLLPSSDSSQNDSKPTLKSPPPRQPGKFSSAVSVLPRYYQRSPLALQVILGGGRQTFIPKEAAPKNRTDRACSRADGRDLFEEWAALRRRRGQSHSLAFNSRQLQKAVQDRVDHVFGTRSISRPKLE